MFFGPKKEITPWREVLFHRIYPVVQDISGSRPQLGLKDISCNNQWQQTTHVSSGKRRIMQRCTILQPLLNKATL
jgi:hypothetical protein